MTKAEARARAEAAYAKIQAGKKELFYPPGMAPLQVQARREAERLRDEFAMKALPVYVLATNDSPLTRDPAAFALAVQLSTKACYEWADAMLDARAKKKDTHP